MSVTDPEVTPRRAFSTKVSAAIVIAVVFIGGVLAGIVADRAWLIRYGGPHPGRALHFLAPRVLNRLDRELNLTDAQRKQIEVILKRRHAKIDQIWRSVHPRLRSEIEQTNAEITKILTPEQQKKFDQMKMHLRRRGGAPRHPRDKERTGPTRSNHS